MMKRQNKRLHMGRRLTAAALAAVMGAGYVTTVAPMQASAEGEEDKSTGYELYPKPQSIDYTGGDDIVTNQVNVVYESGIDMDTRNRLDEVLKLKGDITYTTSEAMVEGKTNILVGINGSGQYVDAYAKENVSISTDSLFDKIDSYVLDNKDNVITVLGVDTDASFYGLTTLYHVFKQMDSRTIQNFHVEDWADVASRGFIEGYYGNPWSTQDRVNLMEWGGYYKLNSYFYAPKDDPKHNREWRSLYSDQEIKEKIIPLAEAGNQSKCRFVYALHPFMNSPIRFTQANYQEDLGQFQAKFEQVIKAGVRQIAILADDAANYNNTGDLGGNNYKRLLEDMTQWLEEMQKTYPDLKLTLPFCTVEYGGWGENYYSDFPENVQIVMTGGRVWGEVSNNFTNSFTSNVGRGPYMWINWPCTDNSKQHLIMGGYSDFLHADVDPSKIEGIVLNPMQQSEPSKVAIFGNACYSWNIWKDNAEADQAWHDSFKYVDHNSAMETEASAALRELSKHMINQAMDSRVRVLQESVELKKILTPFKEKLNQGREISNAEINELLGEFTKLQEAARTYRAKAGDKNLKEQIVYWLDCWEDTTNAAIAYLKGVKAVQTGDTSSILKYNTEGKVAFDKSKNHPFWYLNHNEYAEVGVQHIVPFIKALAGYVSKHAETAMDPNKIIPTFITNRTDNPGDGRVENVFDGKDNTYVSYRNPNTAKKGDYIGVLYNKVIPVEDIRFLMGGGKNHFDRSQLEYTMDGNIWNKIELVGKENAFTGVDNQRLDVVVKKENLPENFQAMGIRLIATANNAQDLWVDIHEIQINKSMEMNKPGKVTGTYTLSNGLAIKPGANNNLDVLKDGKNGSEVWLSNSGDKTVNGAYIQYTFNQPVILKHVYFAQGASKNGDVIDNGAVQYLDSNQQWQDIGTVNSKTVQEYDVAARNIETTAIRVINKAEKGIWWRVGEFRADFEKKPSTDYLYTNVETNILSQKYDGQVKLTQGSATLNKGEYVGVDLGNIKAITSVDTSDLPDNVVLQTSMNGITWTAYSAAAKDGTIARYVRAVNTGESAAELTLTKFEVGFDYVAPKSVESNFANNDTGRDMRTKGNVNAVFDGKLDTYAEITGPQKQGQHITFDLGQVIHFDSLRYYIVETNKDFLRNADIFVSVDGTDSWHKVMTVGKQTANTGNELTAKDMQGDTLYHDSQNPGYMYKEATNLNVDGRYIKITPNENYDHRWVTINELQINGGAYISPERNFDIVSETPEEPGKLPSNALDGNYSTTYKPSEKNGSFTYRLSAPQGVKSIRMVQLGASSNATVTAQFVEESSARSGGEKLGTLSQAINEFIVPEGKTLESITVTWSEIIPEIAEIATATKEVTAGNTSELEALLAQEQPTATWVTDSVKAYEDAKVVAQNVVEQKDTVTQGVVDSAKSALQSAIDNAVRKATNVDELQALVTGAIGNDGNIYTAVSFYSYESAINNLKAALENADNLTQPKADQLKEAVVSAKAALVFSTNSRELAELAIVSFGNLMGENYTTDSFKAVADAKASIDTLVAQDKAAEKGEGERVKPISLMEAKATYEAAVAALVDVTELKAVIAQFDQVNGDLYTEESYNAYKKAVENGKALLTNGTQETVAAAVAEIQEKYHALKNKPEVSLKDVIAQAKALNGEDYTLDSYAALMAIVDEAEKFDDNSYIAKIQAAMKDLVNVKALKVQLTAAQGVDASKYTATSYNALKTLMDQSIALLKSGTQDEVSAMVSALDGAIRGLQLRAQGVEEYLNSIQLKDPAAYTDESYAAYKKAYDKLMAVNPADISADEFAQLKADFEKAQLNLQLIGTGTPGTNGGDNVQTGDNVNLLTYIGVIAVCAAGLVAVVIYRKKKKS